MKISHRVFVVRHTGSSYSAENVTVKKVDEKKLRSAMKVAMTARKRNLERQRLADRLATAG